MDAAMQPQAKPSMTDAEMDKAMQEPSLPRRVVDSTIEGFKGIGRGLMSANDFAGRILTHPVATIAPGKSTSEVVGGLATHPWDTLTGNPTFRETMRGVNSNIPFGNTLVERLGGQPAESPADTAAAPGAQAFGSFAGAVPVGGMVGGLAAKGLETAAPVLGRGLKAIGAGAQERQTTRALEDLEMGANNRARLGARTDVVADAISENPELRAAVGNDKKLAAAAGELKTKAIAEIDKHYAGYKVTLGDTIDNFNARIKALRTEGTSTDAAVANHLEKMRDELTSRLGQRQSTSVKHLRAEQSDFQKRGYGKALPGDEAASTRIEAAREANKAVGDAVIKRVTGLNYAEARAAAEANPDSISAHLLKANDQVSAANRIEATIADRTNRIQPREGIAGKLRDLGDAVKHPVGFGLSLVPRAAAGGLTAADNLVARLNSPGLPAAGNAVARTAAAAPGAAIGRLAELARSGLRGSELTAMAAQMGIPPDQAQGFAAMVAASDARRGP
jgi:hypothetical protein